MRFECVKRKLEIDKIEIILTGLPLHSSTVYFMIYFYLEVQGRMSKKLKNKGKKSTKVCARNIRYALREKCNKLALSVRCLVFYE